MDDYFELFEKILKNEICSENLQKDLVLVETAGKKEIEFLRKSVEKYQMHIRNLVNNDEFGVTESYLKLKDHHKLLQHRNKELENRIDTICEDSTKGVDDLRQQYDNQLDLMKNQYREQIENLEQRNQELLTELHMIQATSAVELDETEKNLKQQLNEINQRLRDELKTSQTLRNDLRLLKDEYEQYKNWNNQKIVDLRRKLEYTKEQNKLLQIKSDLQNQLIDMDVNPVLESHLQPEKSTRIDNRGVNPNENQLRIDDSDFVMKPEFKKPTPVYRGAKKSVKPPPIPSLIDCSEAKSDQTKPERGRLFRKQPSDDSHRSDGIRSIVSHQYRTQSNRWRPNFAGHTSTIGHSQKSFDYLYGRLQEI